MKVLANIPFSLNADQIMNQAHVEVGSDDAADLLSLIALAQKVGRPKAAYAPVYITGREGDEIQIGNTRFTSRTLARNLESVERVFPLIATCGHEMDHEFPGKEDLLKDFWWDLIKTHLLGAAHKYLNEHLHNTFRLGKTATMHPGSGDASIWPIEQQKALFSLLDNVEKELGIHLTDSFLMLPNKTTSGLLFPTETDFLSCEVCHREGCPSRHATFNKTLWEEIQRKDIKTLENGDSNASNFQH